MIIVTQPRTCGIYQILNIVNQNRYTGKSKNIEHRWKGQHLRALRKGASGEPNGHKNKHLQNAFIKYGEANFVLTIVEVLPPDCTDDELSLREKHWRNLVPKEMRYDKSDHTHGPPPIEWTTEARERVSKQWTSERRKKHTESIARYWTPERRKQYSEQRKGIKGRPSTRKGVKATPEQIKKNSESHTGLVSKLRGIPRTAEDKAKMSKALKGKKAWNKGVKMAPCTDERKAFLSAYNKSIGKKPPTPVTKLTEQDVIKMRQLRSDGETVRAIAKQFNIDSGHASRVINRKCWANI